MNELLADRSAISAIGIGSLGLLLVAAVSHETRSGRIPNAIAFGGAGLAILLHAVLPEGSGLISRLPGGLGLAPALGGFIVGVATFLPLYLLRAVAARDVKLMAMVGAFLGPTDAVGVVLLTFLASALRTLALQLRALWLGRISPSGAQEFHPEFNPPRSVSHVTAIALAVAVWLLLRA